MLVGMAVAFVLKMLLRDPGLICDVQQKAVGLFLTKHAR